MAKGQGRWYDRDTMYDMSRPPRGWYGPEIEGRRVRLVRCTDEHTHLEPGLEGTVSLVDGMYTVHVNWDDGHHLGLVPEEDSFELIEGV